MKWLTGLKSIVGLAIVTVATFIPQVSQEAAQAVGDGLLLAAEGVGIILATVGVIHKQKRLTDAETRAKDAELSAGMRR